MADSSYADRDGLIWMNGEMIPWREARLHVLSHGLHYGGSVFEGERLYDGRIFKLKEHSERLIRSGEMIGMPVPYSVEELEAASNEIVEANNLTDGYVRPVSWRGSEKMNVSGTGCSVHVAIACWEWPKYFFPKSGEESGIALGTSRWVRPDPRSAPVQSKSSSCYTIGTLAKDEANAAGFDDALMLDYKGRVAESSGSNLFAVKDGMIRTPVPECFLNGITRQTVMGLARDMGITVEETTIMPEELAGMEEVFVTGTAAEIAPVSSINDIAYEIGPVTKRLQEAYSDLVRQQTPDRGAESVAM
jgi:branched-chain amino acid aminotransferase